METPDNGRNTQSRGLSRKGELEHLAISDQGSVASGAGSHPKWLPPGIRLTLSHWVPPRNPQEDQEKEGRYLPSFSETPLWEGATVLKEWRSEVQVGRR